jgi:hypothetical protein
MSAFLNKGNTTIAYHALDQKVLFHLDKLIEQITARAIKWCYTFTGFDYKIAANKPEDFIYIRITRN